MYPQDWQVHNQLPLPLLLLQVISESGGNGRVGGGNINLTKWVYV